MPAPVTAVTTLPAAPQQQPQHPTAATLLPMHPDPTAVPVGTVRKVEEPAAEEKVMTIETLEDKLRIQQAGTGLNLITTAPNALAAGGNPTCRIILAPPPAAPALPTQPSTLAATPNCFGSRYEFTVLCCCHLVVYHQVLYLIWLRSMSCGNSDYFYSSAIFA